MDPVANSVEGKELSHVRPVLVQDNVLEILFTKVFLVKDLLFCARMAFAQDAKGQDMMTH
jgi:hypothetical protein